MHTPITKSSRIPLLIAGIAAILFSTAAATSAPLRAWINNSPATATATATAATEAAAQAQLDDLPDPIEPRSRTKCPECGVVESMRRVAVEGNSPALYEMTVRLRDGSRRVSRHVNPAQWRPGERIIVIDGAHRQGA